MKPKRSNSKLPKAQQSYRYATDRIRSLPESYAMDLAVSEWWNNSPYGCESVFGPKPVTQPAQALYDLLIFESCWKGDSKDLRA